jgi:Zn-dependent protease with chaperone function
MEFLARFYDGLVAEAREVSCTIGGSAVDIRDAGSRAHVGMWMLSDLFPLHSRRNELRIGAENQPYGARLVFSGFETARDARAALPDLVKRSRRDAGTELRLMAFSTFALASVIVAYVYGVPLLADRLTAIIPPAWEQQFGDKVAEQVEASLETDEGFEVCDDNPDSLANRAIARFAESALAEAGSPFKPEVRVVRSKVPNAFALPGGKAFYFSALLDSTNGPDEFAGVLAHELGHVAHRHAMRQLIASAGTGLLIGFVLGDMTGLSVAGGLGAVLINSHFSREEEAEADQFAGLTAQRLGFDPRALARLLERVAHDDDFSKALAILSTHPLTAERQRALEAMTARTSAAQPAFSADEWLSIKSMCAQPATPAAAAAEPAPAEAPSWPPKAPAGSPKNAPRH